MIVGVEGKEGVMWDCWIFVEGDLMDYGVIKKKWKCYKRYRLRGGGSEVRFEYMSLGVWDV